MAQGSAAPAAVSSHAPVRGHLNSAQIFMFPFSFKSCPREGASVSRGISANRKKVSSHAPVRGHRHEKLVVRQLL